MMTFKQEQRLRRALPDFYVYGKARYKGETRDVTCGMHDDIVKTIKHDMVYSGVFIVFPESVLCNFRQNIFLQTKPQLWEFIEEDSSEVDL